jgi:hypothetical protein
MNKLFVPYEIALEMKQLGFDEPCFGYYEIGDFIFWYDSRQDNELKLNCTAPLYSQAFTFFRKAHGLQSIIIPFAEKSIDENSNTLYYPIINKKQFYGFVNPQEEIGFKTYEEAETECLKQLIKIVKNNKNG